MSDLVLAQPHAPHNARRHAMSYAAYATTEPGFGDFYVTVMSPNGEPVCTIELEVRDGHVVTDVDAALAAEGWRVRGKWSTTDFGAAASVVRR